MGLFASLTALSIIAGPVLMSSVFRAFTAPDAMFIAPGAPLVVAAALMAVTLLVFDVPGIRKVFVQDAQPVAEPG